MITRPAFVTKKIACPSCGEENRIRFDSSEMLRELPCYSCGAIVWWKLGAYQDTALDNLIKSAARRAGIDETLVSNHVLRRSGARMMIYSGSSITEVSSMLGHADTATTMIYLGLTVDDLARVQEKRDDYLDSIRMKVKANP